VRADVEHDAPGREGSADGFEFRRVVTTAVSMGTLDEAELLDHTHSLDRIALA
jgi:hypothetical protein